MGSGGKVLAYEFYLSGWEEGVFFGARGVDMEICVLDGVAYVGGVYVAVVG